MLKIKPQNCTVVTLMYINTILTSLWSQPHWNYALWSKSFTFILTVVKFPIFILFQKIKHRKPLSFRYIVQCICTLWKQSYDVYTTRYNSILSTGRPHYTTCLRLSNGNNVGRWTVLHSVWIYCSYLVHFLR